MNKTQMIVFVSDVYEKHMQWLNVVSDANMSTDIRRFYNLPRDDWSLASSDMTLQKLRAQFDILNAIEG